MYVIQDSNGRFCKICSNGKKSFVPAITNAHSFSSEREASDYLRKHWNKRARNNFKVLKEDEYVSEFQTVDINKDAFDFIATASFSLPTMQEEVKSKLAQQINEYQEEMKLCEGKLSDIQHFLRDADTHLNVYQCYLAIQKLQEILRDRSNNKKELQRLCILRAEVDKAFKLAESFEYEEYKNKVIPDVKAYLFDTAQNN